MGKKWHKQKLGMPLSNFLFLVFAKGTGWDVRKADHNHPEYDGVVSNKRIAIAAFMLGGDLLAGQPFLKQWMVVMEVAHRTYSPLIKLDAPLQLKEVK